MGVPYVRSSGAVSEMVKAESCGQGSTHALHGREWRRGTFTFKSLCLLLGK